ncbi:unnamed protein product [Hermetia illucens]|uniref:Retrovirus-related Pol polyprotein from transposon TNT 1-94-like beta-barrel domain-containing protein n=1 Tax=Hermetia illucens TaxID=343691 RepID=A0A7R8UHN6_HERIL|nr:unnamed protein product [Hermetia illucens]
MSFKIGEDADFREKLDTFTSAVEQLKGMKIDIPNDMLVVLILSGLPRNFEKFRYAIRSKDKTLTGKILDERKRRQSTEPAEDNNALYAGNRYDRVRQTNKNKAKPGKTHPCHICGGTNYWAAQCRNCNCNTANKVNSAVETNDNHYIEVARPDETKNVASTTRRCLDSGCTTHMCSNDDMLSDSQECAANTSSTTARAKGIPHISAVKNNGNIQLNLHNTLLVKDPRINLISVPKIT